MNQVRVDVQNAVIGLQQARARYDSAVKARILQQQTLDADKKKYTLGASTVFQVVQDQQTSGGSGKHRDTGARQLQSRADRLRSGDGDDAGSEPFSIDEALKGRVASKSVFAG